MLLFASFISSFSSFFSFTLLYFYFLFFFFFNDTATTEIYTLSLHDALPILFSDIGQIKAAFLLQKLRRPENKQIRNRIGERSEEHTSELQSHSDLVCRLLLEKKKKKKKAKTNYHKHNTEADHNNHTHEENIT